MYVIGYSYTIYCVCLYKSLLSTQSSLEVTSSIIWDFDQMYIVQSVAKEAFILKISSKKSIENYTISELLPLVKVFRIKEMYLRVFTVHPANQNVPKTILIGEFT